MTNEEKQTLIEDCKREIAHFKRCIEAYPDAPVLKSDLMRQEIALAALTAQPDEWQQRAEAAEAKLAELEKQEPVAWTDEQELREVKNHGCGYLFTVDPVTPNADPRRIINLFTRAAPAINLAELVPGSVGIHDLDPDSKDTEVVTAIAQCEGWNACRAAILRNIEEKAK